MAEESFDVYDVQYMMLENSYRNSIDRKFRLERQISQLQSDLQDQIVYITKIERVLKILEARSRVKY